MALKKSWWGSKQGRACPRADVLGNIFSTGIRKLLLVLTPEGGYEQEAAPGQRWVFPGDTAVPEAASPGATAHEYRQHQVTAGALLLSFWACGSRQWSCHRHEAAEGGRLPVGCPERPSTPRLPPCELGELPVSALFAGDFSAASLPSQRVSVPNVVPPRAAQILGRQQRQCRHDR